MNLNKQLSGLITRYSGKVPVGGTVVGKAGGLLQVRTAGGVIATKQIGVTDYKAGDVVRMRNGLVVAKLRNEASIPIYTV